ncbi:MAG: hypothetical protein KBD06_04640 [Candidatus Pacebacteria bacterium]|nr:hypothetical protein [Candidatus Paceibacterota bacterium]
MLIAGSSHEIATRPTDRKTSCAVFEKIEAALADARSSDDTVGEALSRVRAMMHTEFRDVSIIRSFVIDDPLNFSEWHVVVRFPDGREVRITH